MALFMDIHTLPGPVGLGDAEQAHAADLADAGAVRRRTTCSTGSTPTGGQDLLPGRGARRRGRGQRPQGSAGGSSPTGSTR